jgi:hypothetical protein
MSTTESCPWKVLAKKDSSFRSPDLTISSGGNVLVASMRWTAVMV